MTTNYIISHAEGEPGNQHVGAKLRQEQTV